MEGSQVAGKRYVLRQDGVKRCFFTAMESLFARIALNTEREARRCFVSGGPSVDSISVVCRAQVFLAPYEEPDR